MLLNAFVGEQRRELQRGLPRPAEVLIALLGLLIASPVMVAAAIGVKLTSRGPLLFRQRRMGRGGVPFEMLKFRSMRWETGGLEVTAKGDQRVTRVGRVLRALKIDELPELWNVVRGDMALVGPRPEVPRYVNLDDPLWRAVLQLRPGITDPVSISLRNEEELLACAGSDVDTFYREILLPYKLRGYLEYASGRTWVTDLLVLLKTLVAVVLPWLFPSPSLEDLRRKVAPFAKGDVLRCRK